jgi:hypothetical protein
MRVLILILILILFSGKAKDCFFSAQDVLGRMLTAQVGRLFCKKNTSMILATDIGIFL